MEKLLTPSFENVNCDICQENNYTTLIRMPDYEKCLDSPIILSIVKCKSCGLLYTNPRLTQDSINRLAEIYFTPWSQYKNRLSLSLSSFIRKYPKLRRRYHYFTGEYLSEIVAKSKGRVLDFGCGYADLLEDLTKKGCAAYGIELNPFAVKVCIAKGFNVSNVTLEKVHFPDDFFDTVILRHVLEHLSSPNATLKELYRILKPGGKLFLLCPNADSYLSKLFGQFWVGWRLPYHFYHFTRETIQKLIATTEFQVKKIYAVTPEYFFPMSLNRYLENNYNRFLRRMRKTGIFETLFFRLFIASIFRILDLCFIEKEECLRVELVKPPKE